MEIFVDVIAADGGYVAGERPVPAAVGVGKVVPVACRVALDLGRNVDDRMAVYHVEEMRFLEWPGFTETAVRDLDTLIVVASCDPAFENGKTLEGLWLVAAGLERRARVEARRRSSASQVEGPLGTPVSGRSAERRLNGNVVERPAPQRSAPRPSAPQLSAPQLSATEERPARPTRNGRSATEIALEVALDEALEGLDDIPRLRAQTCFDEVTRVAADEEGLDSVLSDLSDTGGLPAVGSSPSHVPPSAECWSGEARALGSSPTIESPALSDSAATESHDALDATESDDVLGSIEAHAALGATRSHAALDATATCDALDDTEALPVVEDSRRHATLEREIAAAIDGLASPADVVRRSGRAPTFIDGVAAARGETEPETAPAPAPARRKPRTRPPKPPPGARRRRAARCSPPAPPPGRRGRGSGARAPTHL